MQQQWLTYGIDFVHLYVEDVDGDWLENWGKDEERSHNFLLDNIKEFLVSSDIVAVNARRYLGERSLFDFALNLAEVWRINDKNHKLAVMRNLLASEGNSCDITGEVDDINVLNLADSLFAKLTEIL